MKKRAYNILLVIVFLGIVQAGNAASNTTKSMILFPDNYVVRSPEVNVTFSGNAMFGTPCFDPPYYDYKWYVNDSFIGGGVELTRNTMDFAAGVYEMRIEVTDCVGRSVVESREFHVVEPLKVTINGIDAGGDFIYSSRCMQSACDMEGCNPNFDRDAVDYYEHDRVYSYNRTRSAAGNMLSLTYDGSLIYEINDPNVVVLMPSECADASPHGFFTTLIEVSTGDYYVLIGEDDFIGGMDSAGPDYCKDVCVAFIEDFVPLVSDILMCGAKHIFGPDREGTPSNGYSEIRSVNPDTGKVTHFIFADDMSAFLEGRWSYTAIEVDSGTARMDMQNFCVIYKPTEYIIEECTLNFSGSISGGFPPYAVRWVSGDDGVFDEYSIADDPGLYELITTPPMAPPLSEGTHDISFRVQDSLGLTGEDTIEDVYIPWCCTTKSPCHKYWPGREGPQVNVGNEVSYSCDIYEVCRPELWETAREAIYCCKNKCPGGCHKECKTAFNDSSEFLQSNGYLSTDGVKKCAGLYAAYGFGPAEKFMTDYFWPEICCAGMGQCIADDNCCTYDLGTCTCAYHAYNREAQSLPCRGYVSTSALGWASDIAMNKNTCMFSELPAYASMKVINTGTCCDYTNSLVTLLRIIGYGPEEVYAANGPAHCYTMVKFPGSPNFNIIEVTGNWPTPYMQYGISGYEGYPYCSYFNCRNDAGTFPCPGNVWGC